MAIFVVIQGYLSKFSYISRIRDVSRLFLINKGKFRTNQIITNIVIERKIVGPGEEEKESKSEKRIKFLDGFRKYRKTERRTNKRIFDG